jgi:hypothetical protein
MYELPNYERSVDIGNQSLGEKHGSWVGVASCQWVHVDHSFVKQCSSAWSVPGSGLRGAKENTVSRGELIGSRTLLHG